MSKNKIDRTSCSCNLSQNGESSGGLSQLIDETQRGVDDVINGQQPEGVIKRIIEIQAVGGKIGGVRRSHTSQIEAQLQAIRDLNPPSSNTEASQGNSGVNGFSMMQQAQQTGIVHNPPKKPQPSIIKKKLQMKIKRENMVIYKIVEK